MQVEELEWSEEVCKRYFESPFRTKIFLIILYVRFLG